MYVNIAKVILLVLLIYNFFVFCRLLKKICGVDQVKQMVNRQCKGFRVYPHNEFYAVPWWNWNWFFDEKYLNSVKEQTNTSHIIHVWNKFSVDTPIALDTNVPYLNFAKQYCPNVVKQCDYYF